MRRNEIPKVANSVNRVRVLINVSGTLNANKMTHIAPPHISGNKLTGNSGALGMWVYRDTRIPLAAAPLMVVRTTWPRPRETRPTPEKNEITNS